MKLIELKINNFQGIKNLTIEPGGEDMEIRGDNATGKTTIGNAITWLLFGKSLADEKNFSPKTLGEDGSEIHNIENSVEATFENSGKIYTFKKSSKEDWRKKRGSQNAEFSGNIIDYFIGGIPVKLKEFQKVIDELCDPEKAKILTNPFYFPRSLDWQNRRKLLLEASGDIEDEDVINADKALLPLSKMLLDVNGDRVDVSDILRLSKLKMTKINEELKTIPSRIDEAEKAKPDTKDMFKKVFEKEVEENEKLLSDYQTALINLKNGQIDSKLQEALNKVSSELQAKKNAYSEKQREKQDAESKLAIKSAEEIAKAKREEDRYKNSLEDLENDLEKTTLIKNELTRKYKEVKDKVYTGSDTCPTCGQLLQVDKIKEARLNFNLAKAKELEKINAQGKERCSLEIIKNLKDAIESQELLISDSKKEVERLEKNHTELLASFKELTPLEEAETYKELVEKYTEIKRLMDEPNTDMAERIKALKRDIDGIKNILWELRIKLAKIETAHQQEARIKELEEQEKLLTKEYEALEETIYLCESFTKKKVSLLDQKINNRFESVRFKLFEEQINGGLKECCEVLVPCTEGLIPFNAANNAGRINAGVEIIDVLSKHWGIEMPLIIDNAESVTKVKETKLQVIKLVVDEHYKELTKM